MPEWYAELVTELQPFISDWLGILAAFFFLGFVAGIVSLMFGESR